MHNQILHHQVSEEFWVTSHGLDGFSDAEHLQGTLGSKNPLHNREATPSSQQLSLILYID